MRLRKWQRELIDGFPSILAQHRRFILKAPTGAGKTVLASEIVSTFFANRKILVLCHRLVLLEQLQSALGEKHRVHKLEAADARPVFQDYDILLSTNMRALDLLEDAIALADLIIVDEAHRISPNGKSYKQIIQAFEKRGKPEARFIGLTASPERRTGDQKDQLGLAFDAIIDCADIATLIKEGILVPPVYRPHFVHDLDLTGIDISSGDFPVATLAPAIVRSSMIDYALLAYAEERTRMTPRPISAWFCPDVTVAEATLARILALGVSAAIVTAKTPIRERMKLLARHETGEIEAMVSVGVLAEGWDNPHCNVIVHLRPTLSKVLWGQTVGRGLRTALGKDRCLVIDVSSNWSTFGPVEDLEWELWSHRRSFERFKNRFNWIGQQQASEDKTFSFMLCEQKLPTGFRCSHIYRKKVHADSRCPACGSHVAADIFQEQNLDDVPNEVSIRRLFLDRSKVIHAEMNQSVWSAMGGTAWKLAEPKEKIFLVFCMAFAQVSAEKTDSESAFWDDVMATETEIRGYLVKRKIQMVKQNAFDISTLSDAMLAGRHIRTVQAHYGISLCGEVLETCSSLEIERKYSKAVKVAERLAVLGCSARDNLPYFNAAEHLAAV
jgi:superfamily II DNA or RNA helicase